MTYVDHKVNLRMSVKSLICGGYFSSHDAINICNTISAAIDYIDMLEKEGAPLAANQCHDGVIGEYGEHRCKENETLRAINEDLKEQINKMLMTIEKVITDVEANRRKRLPKSYQDWDTDGAGW